MRPLGSVITPAFAVRLLAADPDWQRTIAAAAAQAAVSASGLQDDVVEEALADLRVEHLRDGTREAVLAIAEWLDEEAWAREADGDAAGHLALFRRARAAATVAEAHRDDARTALNETLYEAAHAVADPAFEQVLTDILELSAPRAYWSAQALAALFWPRFVEVDGYVLLADHYSPENLAGFRKQRPDSRSAVEDVINHTHFEDLMNPAAGQAAIRAFGHRAAAAWARALAQQFPERTVTVEFDEEEEILTAFQPEHPRANGA